MQGAPLRVHPVYRLDDYLSPVLGSQRLRSYIQDTLVPKGIAALQHFFTVRAPVPHGEALLLPRRCAEAWPSGECKRVQALDQYVPRVKHSRGRPRVHDRGGGYGVILIGSPHVVITRLALVP